MMERNEPKASRLFLRPSGISQPGLITGQQIGVVERPSPASGWRLIPFDRGCPDQIVGRREPCLRARSNPRSTGHKGRTPRAVPGRGVRIALVMDGSDSQCGATNG